MKFPFLVLLLLVLITQQLGCSSSPKQPPAGQVQFDIKSPDDMTRAFVLLPKLGGMGATVSQPHQVWLQDLISGQSALVLEADKTAGFDLQWKGKDVIAICYAAAQINEFHNTFVVANERSPRVREIEIVLNRVKRLSECR